MATKFSWVVTALLLFLGYGSTLLAQVPHLLHYQGQLITEGSPASGTYRIRFVLYPQEQGGTAIWSEVHDVTVEDGVFDVLLGNLNPLGDALLEASGAIHMGITVGSEAEMTPRLRVAATAFAIRAEQADAVIAGAVDESALRNF